MTIPFLEISLRDVLDAVIVSLFLWAGIVWLRRTRARLALLGLGILGAVYLLARALSLELTAWMLQGFFAVFVIVVVVVFQEDLRRLFEQIAVFGLRRRPAALPPDAIDTLVRAVTRLAEARRGALLVVPGQEPLERHVEGGIPLDARISEPLLLSLFDTHSPGHDGAVLVRDDRATRFAAHLPLSSDRDELGPGGTRHAAALGLAERTDALCIAVSEERGTISVARDGRIRVLAQPADLARELRRFLARGERKEARTRWRAVGAHWREGLLAAALAAGIWALVIPGAGAVRLEREAPVVVENLPPGLVLESVDPERATVVLSGPRRSLFFGEPEEARVRIDAFLARLGRRTFALGPSQVQAPPGFEVVSVEPRQVRLSLREEAEPQG